MTKISTDTLQGLERITVENERVRLSLLPQVGGKIVSLVLKQSEHEYLWSSGRSYRQPPFDAHYIDHDISGLDECFPTIAEGFYPEEPWKGTHLADHGEVWTLPWETRIEGQRVSLSVSGIRFPYRLSKVLSLDENTVRIDYRLQNLSPFEFKYIWAAHPMLVATPETKIMLPGRPRIRTNWSKHDRLGKLLYETTWPVAAGPSGESIDLSGAKSPTADQATKFFTTRLEEGWCGLRDAKTGHFIRLSFPVEKIPYVGVWINEGGWPSEQEPHYHIALEPATGCPDSLAVAIERNEHACIKGLTEQTWSLTVTVGISEEND